MEIQIGDDEPKTGGITNPEMYYYALGVFEEGQRHNDRVARERREKEQMNRVQAKNNTEISPVVIFIVLIIALIMCIN